jgi:hypothetical protein
MKYAVKISSGVVIYSYIPSFIKIDDSGIQKLIEGGYTDSMVIHKPNFIF